MAIVTADRILETTTTTGVGPVALGGAYIGYGRFSSIAGIAIGDVVHYMIQELDNVGRPTGAYETGRGTYSAANVLTRTEIVRSSNANRAVDFAVGTKQVGLTPLSPATANVREDWRKLLGLSSSDTIEAAGFKGPLTGKAATAGVADRALAADVATSLQDVLPVARGGTGATTAANARAALGLNLVDNVRQVNRAGDTMTGNLTIQPATNATLSLVKPNTGYSSGIIGYRGTLARWGMDLGGASAEVGGNAGSDFGLYRYADDGSYIATALHINRATGRMTVGGPVEATGQIYSASNTVAVEGFKWTNMLAWGLASTGFYMDGPFRRVTALNMDSLGGAMQVLGYHRPGIEALMRFNVFDSTFDMRRAQGHLAARPRRARHARHQEHVVRLDHHRRPAPLPGPQGPHLRTRRGRHRRSRRHRPRHREANPPPLHHQPHRGRDGLLLAAGAAVVR